jgi:hypothetical protein
MTMSVTSRTKSLVCQERDTPSHFSGVVMITLALAMALKEKLNNTKHRKEAKTIEIMLRIRDIFVLIRILVLLSVTSR